VKFGKRPTVCYTNPANLTGPVDDAGVRVEARKNVLLNHFMVGVE